MPPIRQPSFADVLEDVAHAPHDEFGEDEGPPAPVNQDWLFHIFVEAAEAVATPKRHDAYRENAGDIFQMPLFDATADEDSIAAELDLAAARNLDDLARIRRSFARRNHPDKLASAPRRNRDSADENRQYADRPAGTRIKAAQLRRAFPFK
ncbi:MAG: hypothetical protein WDN02_06030 [Methylovirgula sp.]|uniref:hypothetical protein n=1 Tax=Methylovirgula sp. TaxID=1978224 RepID=UPI00307641AB